MESRLKMAAFVHRSPTQQKEKAGIKKVMKVGESMQIRADCNLYTHA
jgi:hypothetical protein